MKLNFFKFCHHSSFKYEIYYFKVSSIITYCSKGRGSILLYLLLLDQVNHLETFLLFATDYGFKGFITCLFRKCN